MTSEKSKKSTIKNIVTKIKNDTRIDYFLLVTIFVLIGLGVYSNIREQQAVDNTKLPSKVENDRSFQRWITNLKNKDIVVDADEFTLKEEAQVYNTKWIKIRSIDETGMQDEFNKTLEENRNIKKVVFSPSDRAFLDYRNETRNVVSPVGNFYQSNEVRFYGQRDNKVIEARLLDCSVRANCYFDRAYFLSNDLFVITEFSRNINKKDEMVTPCTASEKCTYTIKLHMIDLINNSKLTYESKPIELVLEKVIPEL